jgi:hypothetical protein
LYSSLKCHNMDGFLSTLKKYKYNVTSYQSALTVGEFYNENKSAYQAEYYYNLSHRMVPGRLLPFFNCMKMFETLNHPLKAIFYANKLLSIKPKVASENSKSMQADANQILQKFSLSKTNQAYNE